MVKVNEREREREKGTERGRERGRVRDRDREWQTGRQRLVCQTQVTVVQVEVFMWMTPSEEVQL